MTKVLIVEDDGNIAQLLQLYLEKEGFETQTAPDGGRGVELFRSFQPDLVLLDIMLPVLDGWGVCRKIRETSDTPIIMLTAKGETEDRVGGLEMGADDYIVKPFEMKEVLARIRSSPNRVFTRNQLLDEVWGFDYFGDSRTVDVHIKRLREKLEGVSDQWSLKTVWGVGYKFELTA